MKLIQIAMFLALLGPLLVLANPGRGGSSSKGGGSSKDSDLSINLKSDKAGKPGDKKPDDKKPEEKKDDDKKPDEKKDEGKKGDDKKGDDKKDDGKKDEGNKSGDEKGDDKKDDEEPKRKHESSSSEHTDDSGGDNKKGDKKDKGKKPDSKRPKQDDENKDPNEQKDLKEIEYDCTGVENACKNMCWGRFCRKDRIGYASEPLVKGGMESSKAHRGPSKSGWIPPSTQKKRKDDKVCTVGKKQKTEDGIGGWSENPDTMKSMDEWPMAALRYPLDNKDEEYAVGFRCISLSENQSECSFLHFHFVTLSAILKYSTNLSAEAGQLIKRVGLDEPFKIKFMNAGKDKL